MKRIIFLTIIFCVILAPFSAIAVSEPLDFKTMFNEHGAIMLLIDPVTGEILYANEAAANYYGYSKNQLQAMKIAQINTLSEDETKKEMQAAAAENRNYFLFKHRLSNNKIRTVEVFSYPVKYGEKEVLFSIVHDVTEKVLLQEYENRLVKGIFFAGTAVILILIFFVALLLKSHRSVKRANLRIENFDRLRKTFIDADTNLMYLKDENFKYVFVNRAVEKFYGKSENEIVGKTDFLLSESEFANIIRQNDLTVLEKMELLTEEICWNGRIYIVTKFPVEMLNGSYGVGATIRDVTKDREREHFKDKVHERNNILLDMLSLNFQNRQEQLDYALHKILSLAESQYGYIYYYDEKTQEFNLNSWTNGVMEDCRVIKPQTKYQLNNTGIWGEVVRQRKPIIVNNFSEHNPLKRGYPEGHVQLNKFMSVPIFIDEKIVAVVGLGNKNSDYDENDVINVTILMSGVWQAVQRKEALEQLANERQKYLQTLFSIGDGVLVVDNAGKVEILNKVAQRLTGWTTQEAFGKHYKEVFVLSHELEGHHISDPIESVFETKQVQELGNHAVLTSKDKTRYFLEDSAAPVLNENGECEGAVLVFRDVTEKKEQKKKIEYLSFHDELTGLYNRRYFEEELKRIDEESNLPISIVMADVNGLKLTNDVFGHAYGDNLLKAVAEVFQSSCRADDIISRWGGDEFVLLLPKTGKQEAENIVQRLKDNFSQKRIKAIKGSVSLGVDCKADSNVSIMEVLDNAEEKMYSEKTLERDFVKDEELNSIVDALHKSFSREREHSQKVSELCEKVGVALGLSEVELRNLREAGYLHDLGKIVLEPELLEPTRQLTKEEIVEIRRHPIVGYRILSFSDKTLNLADAVLAHHEHWDGSGYPKGLKREEIPLLARIISVVENYERDLHESTITSPKTKEKALQSIENGMGILFDPEIAKLFIHLMENDNE